MTKTLKEVLGPHLASTIDPNGGSAVLGMAEFHPTMPDLIGRVFLRWSSLETGLADLLGAIMDQSPMVGRALYYSSNNFKARFDLVRSAHYNLMNHGQDWDKINSVFNAISRLSKFRNRLAHTFIVMTNEQPNSYEFDIIEPATNQFHRSEPAKPSDITSHLQSLARLGAQLSALIKAKNGKWLRADMGNFTFVARPRPQQQPTPHDSNPAPRQGRPKRKPARQSPPRSSQT